MSKGEEREGRTGPPRGGMGGRSSYWLSFCLSMLVVRCIVLPQIFDLLNLNLVKSLSSSAGRGSWGAIMTGPSIWKMFETVLIKFLVLVSIEDYYKNKSLQVLD